MNLTFLDGRAGDAGPRSGTLGQDTGIPSPWRGTNSPPSPRCPSAGGPGNNPTGIRASGETHLSIRAGRTPQRRRVTRPPGGPAPSSAVVSTLYCWEELKVRGLGSLAGQQPGAATPGSACGRPESRLAVQPCRPMLYRRTRGPVALTFPPQTLESACSAPSFKDLPGLSGLSLHGSGVRPTGATLGSCPSPSEKIRRLHLRLLVLFLLQ